MPDRRDLAKRIGRIIRRLRHEASLSQEKLAERCELHRTYVGAVERGEKNVTVVTARKFAEAFDLSLSQFFRLVENETRSS